MGGNYSLSVKAELANLGEVRQFVATSCQMLGAEASVVSDLVLAVDEAVTNIIIHGYKQSCGPIEIDIGKTTTALVVRLQDSAPEFNPCFHEKPDLGSNLKTKTGGGFGVHLIKSAVDEVRYRAPAAGGNELTLVKQTPTPQAPAAIDDVKRA